MTDKIWVLQLYSSYNFSYIMTGVILFASKERAEKYIEKSGMESDQYELLAQDVY